MQLFRVLSDDINNIDSVILNQNIFGVIKGITVKYKNGKEQKYSGADEKFLDLVYDLKEEELAKKLDKKIKRVSDKITKIAIYQRDKNFKPQVMDIYLENGEYVHYDPLINSNVISCLKRDKTSYDKYMIKSFMEKYGYTKEALFRMLDNDPYIKDYIRKKEISASRRTKPFEEFIQKHTDRKGDEDIYIESKEVYEKIDVVSPTEPEEIPEKILVYYKNGRSVTVDDPYMSYKFIKDASRRGLKTCNYYPTRGEVTPVNLNVHMKKMDDYYIAKNSKFARLFAVFNKNKTYKK